MTVAIVILNWDGEAHLRTFLPSVIEHRGAADVIVADNGSTDGSEAYIAGLPEVGWLGLRQNWGFAEGYNRALAQVEADVFVLLNSDVRVTPGWLDAPLAKLREDARVAAVQPKVLAQARPTHFEYAGASGGYVDALGYPYCRGRVFDTVEEDRGQYDDAVEVDWATGCCLFFRAAAYRALGGLDGSYFAHMEEIDLCWRARRAGYQCWVTPESVVYHLGGGTLNYSSPRKTELNFRNSLTTLYKNLPRWQVPIVLWARVLLDAVAAFKFLVAGEGGQVLAIGRAHRDFWRGVWAGGQEGSGAASGGGSRGPSRFILWDYYVRGRRRFGAVGGR